MKQRAATLIELLTVIAVIVILCALLLPVTLKSLRRAKSWIWGTYYFHENQLNTYLDDNARQENLLFWSTAKPQPWVWVRLNSNGTSYVILR